MPQEILINITPREVRVAILENKILQEIYIERNHHQGIVSNIYKGRVTRVLPGIQAAFVDIGLEKAAFLHLSDMANPDNKADIREVTYVGQDLLVQVYKDPLGSKGARLTTEFTIPARYLVLTPGVSEINLSQKIEDEAERERLQSLMTPTPYGGYIFRTNAEGVSKEDLESDKNYLDTVWAEIRAQSEAAKQGDLVYEEIPIVLRVLRDLVSSQIEKIRIDNLEAVTQMLDFAKRYMPNIVARIEHHASKRPIFDVYGVEDELQNALERKILLKSGGHIVIDQTEAMTTVDVNTGSEDNILKTNLEAVDVIARQIRLRNLGGIIIIDLIDMKDDAHKKRVLKALAEALSKDTVKIQISELSSLGLVQLTRKRTRESLEHILCTPCTVCRKRGSIKSFETMSYEIFREIERIAQNFAWAGFNVVASQGVVDYILNVESTLLADMEMRLSKKIKLRVESTYPQEKYEILPLPEKE